MPYRGRPWRSGHAPLGHRPAVMSPQIAILNDYINRSTHLALKPPSYDLIFWPRQTNKGPNVLTYPADLRRPRSSNCTQIPIARRRPSPWLFWNGMDDDGRRSSDAPISHGAVPFLSDRNEAVSYWQWPTNKRARYITAFPSTGNSGAFYPSVPYSPWLTACMTSPFVTTYLILL